ncbi:MAG: DegT/DnrJ/EryC1/StrS family aminotransferase [bacterium]|nr:DegT/DnrJ/EryC1/StrS family aminotransferase [bacterium]
MDKLALSGGEPVRETPWPEWPFYQTDEEARAVVDALRSDHLCSAHGGGAIAQFEADFAEWCGAVGAVTVNSGSSSLQVALAAVGVGPGDEVIVPCYTYYSSATSVLVQGAIPVFADIDRETANLDPVSFESLITDRTKAVMPVHANGIPVDMDAVMAIADAHGIQVVEDCSHAHGAVYKGQMVGTLGQAGAFSIQHKKILSVGEGGVVVSRDPEVVARARRFVNLGGGSSTGDLGPNLRMGELHGALALVRMQWVDEQNDQRRENARMLAQAVAELPGLQTVPEALPDGVNPTYYNFILDYKREEIGVDRERFVEAVQAEGVPLRVNGYRPLNTMPVFANQEAWPYKLSENQPILEGRTLYGEGVCPVTEAFLSEGNLELKIHPPCGEQEMTDAAGAMRKVLTQVGEL